LAPDTLNPPNPSNPQHLLALQIAQRRKKKLQKSIFGIKKKLRKDKIIPVNELLTEDRAGDYKPKNSLQDDPNHDPHLEGMPLISKNLRRDARENACERER
jgi:hypothetical protein